LSANGVRSTVNAGRALPSDSAGPTDTALAAGALAAATTGSGRTTGAPGTTLATDRTGAALSTIGQQVISASPAVAAGAAHPTQSAGSGGARRAGG
jgi:hypothetical protein